MNTVGYIPHENYEHKFAKETLCKWLIDGVYPFTKGFMPRQAASGFQVWMEFPFVDSDGNVDVPDYAFYDKYRNFFRHIENPLAETTFPINADGSNYYPMGAWPPYVKYVVDIAVMTKGYCHTVIEIENKHPVDSEKFNFFTHRVQLLIEVPAHSILQQYKVPETLKGVK